MKTLIFSVLLVTSNLGFANPFAKALTRVEKTNNKSFISTDNKGPVTITKASSNTIGSLNETDQDKACEGSQSIPLEFFNKFSKNGRLEIEVKDNVLYLSKIYYGSCFTSNVRFIDYYDATNKKVVAMAEFLPNKGFNDIAECMNTFPEDEPLAAQVFKIDMDRQNKNASVVWGYRGSEEQFEGLFDIPIEVSKNPIATCVFAQKISDKARIFTEQGKELHRLANVCQSNDIEDILAEIDKKPEVEAIQRILEATAMDELEDRAERFAAQARELEDLTDLKNSADFKTLFESLKSFIWGKEGKGGLLERHNLISKKKEDKYEAEKKRTREFFQKMYNSFFRGKETVKLLNSKAEFNLAEKASFIGEVAAGALDTNSKLKFETLLTRVSNRHKAYVGKEIGSHKKAHEEKIARENYRENFTPDSDKRSSLYSENYYEKSSELQQVREQIRSLNVKAYQQMAQSCSGTKSYAGGLLTMQPFTRSGWNSLQQDCHQVQNNYTMDMATLKNQEMVLQQQALAFQRQYTVYNQLEQDALREYYTEQYSSQGNYLQPGGAAFQNPMMNSGIRSEGFAASPSQQLHSPYLNQYDYYSNYGAPNMEGRFQQPFNMGAQNNFAMNDPSLMMLQGGASVQAGSPQWYQQMHSMPIGGNPGAVSPQGYQQPNMFGPPAGYPNRSPAGNYSYPYGNY